MLPLPVLCVFKLSVCKPLHIKQQGLDLCSKLFKIIVQQ